MADASSAPASGDNSAGEKRKSVQQPVDDVEMEDLSQSRADTTDPVSTSPQGDENKPIPVPDGETKDPSSAEPSSSAQHEAPAPLDDEDLTIDPVEPQATNGANTVNIMLQLTNGIRHPFRIDEKYLAKRNVTITGKTEDGNPDPASITVYTFKELILRDWRQDWEEPPREPSSIRLIHFGKLLEDRNQLSHYNFSTTNKNWVHMTVKPQDLLDEEEAAKKTKDSSSQSGRSGCCVIL